MSSSKVTKVEMDRIVNLIGEAVDRDGLTIIFLNSNNEIDSVSVTKDATEILIIDGTREALSSTGERMRLGVGLNVSRVDFVANAIQHARERKASNAGAEEKCQEQGGVIQTKLTPGRVHVGPKTTSSPAQWCPATGRPGEIMSTSNIIARIPIGPRTGGSSLLRQSPTESHRNYLYEGAAAVAAMSN